MLVTSHGKLDYGIVLVQASIQYHKVSGYLIHFSVNQDYPVSYKLENETLNLIHGRKHHSIPKDHPIFFG